MILYVNGDSHSAGAEAVNDYCFAGDDPLYYALGDIPHPDNERVCYGCLLANELSAILHLDAQSASSNARIIRTTRKYLETNIPDFVIIGWSTWEREEWLHDGVWYQVNSSGIDYVPDELQQQYKHFVANINWSEKIRTAHTQIHELHTELLDLGIPHLFFNTYLDFHNEQPVDWHDSYIDPYDPNMTYWKWLTDRGFKSTEGYHFHADGHAKWAEFLLPRLTRLL